MRATRALEVQDGKNDKTEDQGEDKPYDFRMGEF
jgi:hypothetical protein